MAFHAEPIWSAKNGSLPLKQQSSCESPDRPSTAGPARASCDTTSCPTGWGDASTAPTCTPRSAPPRDSLEKRSQQRERSQPRRVAIAEIDQPRSVKLTRRALDRVV